MEKIYFSKNNFNILYNIIGENIYQKYKTDLSKDPNFENNLTKCLKNIYKDRNNFNIPENLDDVKYSNELSKRVLDRMLSNLKNNLEKKNKQHVTKIDDINNSISQRTMSLNDSYSNKISNRPIPSVVNNSQDMNHKYEQLQNKRSVDNEEFQNINLSYQDTNNMSQFQNISKGSTDSSQGNYASYQGSGQYDNRPVVNNSSGPVQTVIRDSNEVNNRFEQLQSSRNNELNSQPVNIDFRIKTNVEKNSNINDMFEREQKKRVNEVKNNPHNDPQNNTWSNQFQIQDQHQNNIIQNQRQEMIKNPSANKLNEQFTNTNSQSSGYQQISNQFNNNSQNVNTVNQYSNNTQVNHQQGNTPNQFGGNTQVNHQQGNTPNQFGGNTQVNHQQGNTSNQFGGNTQVNHQQGNTPNQFGGNTQVNHQQGNTPNQFGGNTQVNQQQGNTPNQFGGNTQVNRQNNSQKVNMGATVNENFLNNNDTMLPGLGSASNGNLESQFSSMFNSENEVSNLASKFEEKSIQDRLAEFQRNRESDLELKPDQSTIMDTNQVQDTSNKYIGAPRLEYQESEQDHPKSIYSPLKINNEHSSIEPSYVDNSTNNIPKPEIPKDIIKTYNLIVNSIDRKWEGVILADNVNFYESINTSRYDYVVNFNPTYDSYVKIPVYENNEFIAYDFDKPEGREKILTGIRDKNTSGFTYKNRVYDRYKPNEPRGKQMDTETKIFKGTQSGVNLDKSFKNIVSIKLKRLIMPSHDRYISLNYSLGKDDNDKPIKANQYIPLGSKREPYLIIHIKELTSNIVSTSTFNKPIFCKTHFDKEYCYNEANQGVNVYNSIVNGNNKQYQIQDYSNENSERIQCNDNNSSRGWVYYKNDDGDVSEYFTSPISELNKLSIQILKPNGEIYSEENDNLMIKEMLCLKPGDKNNDIGEACIILTLNKYVNSKYFRLGDKILVRGLVFENEESNKYLTPIKNYLEKGASVIGTKSKEGTLIGEYTADLNINQIVIKYKVTDIKSDGSNNYFGENNEILEVDKLSDLMVSDEKYRKCNGFLLNSNLQHTFIFEIKVKEKDALSFNTPLMV